MKSHTLNFPVAALTFTLVILAPPARAQKKWDAPRVVTNYCSGCHGVDGNSQLPYIPKLAGLDAAYAEKKIGAFKEPVAPRVDELYWWTLKTIGAKKDAGNVTREERINMEGVAHAAKPAVLKEAAEWYARQPAKQGRTGDKALMEDGKKLFTQGLPAEKILPCMACHGPEAQGKGIAPRLAGQNAEYMEGQLVKFRKGDRTHAPEMTTVTRDLNPDQARAVAVYLQAQ